MVKRQVCIVTERNLDANVSNCRLFYFTADVLYAECIKNKNFPIENVPLALISPFFLLLLF